MKKGSTFFLKGAVIFFGILVLALCVFAVPEMWKGGSGEFPKADMAVRLIMVGIYLTTVPFFVALWQTLKLLRYIDQGKAFSTTSVQALKNIKYCASAIAILYFGGLPLLFPIADSEDAPGMVVIGLVIACAPLVIATFAAVMQRILQDAIALKSENDLTV